MTRARFFLPPERWQEGSLVLTGNEARHCAQVTRHRVGDEIIVFDGQGRRAVTQIKSLNKQQVDLSILQISPPSVAGVSITLLQGITKGETMEWIIEKAVELGVRSIIPVVTARCVVRLDTGEAAKKREKWQRMALEACKQCGQDWLPEVAVPCDLRAATALCTDTTLRFVASLQEQARPLRDLWNGGAGASAAVAIGPEGDFTDEEQKLFSSQGWLAWSLGARTLRSETAAICALSILGYELADFHHRTLNG